MYTNINFSDISTLGNILWILFGGFLLSIYYAIYGLILCITIIGIPFGIQMFKMAGLALCPFGRDVEIMAKGGCINTIFNILWIVTGWWEIALLHLVLGLMCAITIIGIPFAKAHWRLLKMSFLPFGSTRI